MIIYVPVASYDSFVKTVKFIGKYIASKLRWDSLDGLCRQRDWPG